MADFEFPIPLSREDLLRRINVTQYVVDEVLPVRMLPGKLQECKSSYRTRGPQTILENFDTFYSVLKHIHEVEINIKEEAWELLVKGLSAYANQLATLLDMDLDPDERKTHLNTLKMTSYLVCQFIDVFEASCKPDTVVAGKGRKKISKRDQDSDTVFWEGERERGIRSLLQTLQLSVQRLWDPPVVEEEFVNMVTGSCYKLLENAAVCKDKTTRDAIFQLLAIMVKKYNHSLGCSLKMIQLLRHFEHLASPLASAVEIFAIEFGVKSIAGDIMREIGRIDAKDLARDTSGTRAYSLFLLELAEKIPAVMLPSISVILGLLDEESYSMRNSVLGVLGEMVVRVLSKDSLDDKQKTTRDQFLDKLEDHIHDVHAFTRSKTLQIWLHIVNEKALPLPRQHELLKLVIGRLQDKSSQVRRYAVQLLTAMLRSNPFAGKLSLEELKANYEKEKEKLKEMMPEEETAAPAPESEEEQAWKTIIKDATKAVKKYFKKQSSPNGSDEEEEDDSVISEEDSVDSIKQRLQAHLKSEEYAEAIKLLLAAHEAWPNSRAFCIALPPPEGSDEEEDEEKLMNDKQELIVKCLRAAYLGENLEGELIAAAENIEATQQPAHESPSKSALVNETSKQQVLVQYLKDCLNFVTQIQASIPLICQLLGSKNSTDVMEAINFFVTGFEFGVTNMMIGIRRMLVLIWSRELSIKEAVVEAYKRLYLNPEGGNAKAKSLAVVNNLTALTVGATMGDLTSLEELVTQFVKSGELDQRVIQTLWERFAMKIPNTTQQESRGALLLLGMAAGANVAIVRSNIEVLVKEGLGPRGEEDFLLIRDACIVLAKLSGEQKERGAVAREPFRLPMEHEIFTRLTELLITGMPCLERPHWIPMAEQAVAVIYKLAEKPDFICEQLLKKLAAVVMNYGQPEQPLDAQPVAEVSADEGFESQADVNCPAGLLARLLSMAGQVALRHLVHLDVAIFGELKRRQALQEEEDGNEQKKNKRKSASNKSKEEELTAEEEMGLTGATADDMESEYIRKVTETEIVSGDNLLAALRPLVLTVCGNQSKYPDPELRAAASLALAKFMLVSSEFCEEHLALLFTVMEKTPHANIRANTIIALGDLTFRFPNLIEPWTPNLYARLRDDSPKVRKSTLMMLTHLILNDMVKVKGQISELATCIVDDNQQISDLSKLFFHELAKKGNAIYNIMPDMISRLSDPEVGVEEDNFRIIMRYLFSFIQKDRQCESLVEKLCHRFRATRLERQWRDLAFCLSMLNYNEKSMRKLQENFACFADKLGEEDVYQSFVTVMSNAKKFAKIETKTIVEEMEQKVEECHSKGRDDDETTQKAIQAMAAKSRKGKSPFGKSPGGRGRGKRRPGKTPARKQKPKDDSDSEVGLESSDEEDLHPAKRPGKGKPKLSFSSDEDEEDDFLLQSQAKGKAAAKKPSDEENLDPNVEDDSPLVKRRHKSVNAHKSAPDPTPTGRRSRRKLASRPT